MIDLRTVGERADRLFSSRPARYAAIVVAVIALVLSLYVGIEYRTFVNCLAKFNDASTIATQARADAASQDRASDAADKAATDELIKQVFSATSPQAAKSAYEHWLAVREQTDKDRAATQEKRARNPLPAPPSVQCR